MRPLSDLGLSGRRPEEVSQNENNYLDTVAAGISGTNNPVRYRLIFCDCGESMNWTTEYPTKPGFYWIKFANRKSPEVVFLDPEMGIHLIGNSERQDRSLAAEWQGPIEPERENQNTYRVRFRPISGTICRECSDPADEFISWPIAKIDGRQLFGIICRECWIKRLTPEQRKVYML